MPARSRTRSLTLTGLAIALIVLGAFITISLGPIPFTLHTMMIGIVICLLPPPYAVVAIGGYILLGCFGLPVFSGFRGGIGVLAGPTGGFLVGFFLAAIITSAIRSAVASDPKTGEETRRPSWFVPLIDVASLVILSVVYYTFGCLWFMVSSNVTFEAAFAACVLPFVAPDIIKAAVGFICVQPVRTALGLGLAPAR